MEWNFFKPSHANVFKSDNKNIMTYNRLNACKPVCFSVCVSVLSAVLFSV